MYVTDTWPIYCSAADISNIIVGVSTYTCHCYSLLKTSPIVHTWKRQNRFLGTKLYCIDFLLICKYFATEQVPLMIVHLCETVDLNIQNIHYLFELILYLLVI